MIYGEITAQKLNKLLIKHENVIKIELDFKLYFYNLNLSLALRVIWIENKYFVLLSYLIIILFVGWPVTY